MIGNCSAPLPRLPRHKSLNEASSSAGASPTRGSRELLEHILKNEESHTSWLEAQLSLIEQVGEGNYLAQQIKES